MEKFYVTTPIYYVNAKPHIGHAYTSVITDILARYHRLRGDDTWFLTGTDEHGQKIARSAEAAGTTPEKFTDELSQSFRALTPLLNLSNDDFIRTTEERHIRGAQEFWQRVEATGDIYKKNYHGLYCVGHEAFVTEKDLVDGKCPDHGTTPELLEEENYFFRLEKYSDALKKFFHEHSDFVVPEAKFTEMQALLAQGLEDVSISRSKEKLSWGVPVPNDDTQVMYVWFEALTNYITALGFGSAETKAYKKFWPGVHVMGKEINRLHSLLWPAMCWSAGLEPPLHCVVHGWITIEGQKMSKTLGNVVTPQDIVTRVGVDATRYFFSHELSIVNDGNFSWTTLDERYRGNLANGLGNLVARITTMLEKYCAAKIPPTTKPAHLNTIAAWDAYDGAMLGYRPDKALDATFELIHEADRLITNKKPWELAKSAPEKVPPMLYELAETVRHIALMVLPIMPETAHNIIRQLGMETLPKIAEKEWGGLVTGTPIQRGPILFKPLSSPYEPGT